MLVSANKILAPESTRTRRVLAAPPTVVTDGESVVVVKIEAEVEGRNDTDKGELSRSRDSHN